jgi:Ran GTPase-activating protein (RanGAP) involved in mRNA processing and transport
MQVIRRHKSTHLKLSHLSIGDRVAGILADSLFDLPGIESVDLSDNNLTDLSLVPCVKSLAFIPNLTEINLSFNHIGPKAAGAISDYVSLPNCPLQRLILQNANVDDCDCDIFMKRLHKNVSLTYIDLSSNKIGSAESLNVVKRTVTTGGEAIAALLRSGNSHLKTLKLGWNMIRLHSAVDLANSLVYNKTLIYLDLSCNPLGRDGGDVLGRFMYTSLFISINFFFIISLYCTFLFSRSFSSF